MFAPCLGQVPLKPWVFHQGFSKKNSSIPSPGGQRTDAEFHVQTQPELREEPTRLPV